MRIDWHKDRFLFREGTVEKACPICSRKFYLPLSKLNNQVRCGKECNEIHRKNEKESKKRACETCGKEFYPRSTQINAGLGRFCSQKCNGVSKIGESNPVWKGGEKAAIKRYKESHPGYWKIYVQNRKAIKRGFVGCVSKGLFEKLFKLQMGKCVCCRADLTKVKAHMDHIIPLAKNGDHADKNIQLLCQRCNQQKSSKDPITFMQSRGFLL